MLPQFLTFIVLLNMESEDSWFNVNRTIKIDMEIEIIVLKAEIKHPSTSVCENLPEFVANSFDVIANTFNFF